jgi:5-methylcytosine-specific restriction endonuclease McrA
VRAVVTRVLTRDELAALEALARTLERQALAEERDRLLGVLRADGAPRELSVSEAAALTRKCRQTIRNWIKAGRLTARADQTNHYHVPIDALRAAPDRAGAPGQAREASERRRPRMRPVLLLNQDFAPLNLCRTPRALALVERGKAEVVAYGLVPSPTPARLVDHPVVIRLSHYLAPPRRRDGFSRRAVLRRDGYACQYCGAVTPRPTLDHVVPRRLGGGASWTNLVTACRDCNQRKAGRTPEQAGMPLLRRPVAPSSG